MELHRIIKSDAKRALRSCWGKSVAAGAVLLFSYLSVSAAEAVLLFVFSENSAALDFLSITNADLAAVVITGIAVLAFVVLIPPLSLGYTKLHFSFADGKGESVSAVFDLFSSFKSFFKSIIFSVALTLRYLVCTAAALIPGVFLFYLANTFIVSNDRTIQLLKISACCVSIALTILCLALAFIYSQRWFASSYYFISGRKIHESFKLSAKASKGMKSHIAGFKISFFGWWLLGLIVLPLFWVVPYYSLSCAIYAKYLIEKLEHIPVETPITSTEPEETEDEI